MKRLGWVLVGGWLVACTSDPAHVDRPPDVLVAETLAAREAPAITLPDRPVTRLGRCAVELGARPNHTVAQVAAAFNARNGNAWDAGRYDPSSRLLQTITSTAPTASGEPLADREALASAIDFLVTNYDLFGMTRDDLAHITPQLDLPLADQPTRRIILQGDHFFDGPAEDPPATWGMTLWIDPAGKVALAAMTSGELLPPLGLCDQPGLQASDPRVVASVIGYHLVFGGIAGMPVDAGEVVAADVQPAKLVTFRQQQDDKVTVRVAYEIAVMHDSLPWLFIVDAETGALVTVIQQFYT
jgi:hypothetical protein